MNQEDTLFSIVIVALPAIIAGMAGYLLRGFEKKKEREFELAKIKSDVYNDIISSARAALFGDYIRNKTKQEQLTAYYSWQTLLKKFDMLWLYGSKQSLDAFKLMMHSYGDDNLEEYREYLGQFVNAARNDVLSLYGEKNIEEVNYEFLSYNLPVDKLPNGINRLAGLHDTSNI